MAKKAWAKVDGKFLEEQRFVACSAYWAVFRDCARLAAEADLGAQAITVFESAADELEGAIAECGNSMAEVDFFELSKTGLSGQVVLDELTNLVLEKADKKNMHSCSAWLYSGARPVLDMHVASYAKQTMGELPQSWKDGRYRVDYAGRGLCVAKSDSVSMPAELAEVLVERSRVMGLAAEKARAAEVYVKDLKKKSKGLGWGERESLVFEMALLSIKSLGKSRGFLGKESTVEFMGEEARFAPQKAYAAFLTGGGAAYGHPEGFWGSTNKGGADLGAAKLFESVERAKMYFERGGFKDYALVEVDLRISGVAAGFESKAPDSLARELALSESEQIEKALERADVGALRARLALLEVRQETADSEAPSSETSKRKRL